MEPVLLSKIWLNYNKTAIGCKIKIRVSDCCLTPSEQFFQLEHGKNKMHINEIMMMFTCTRQIRLCGRQHSTGRHVIQLGHNILIPQPPVFALFP